MKIVEEPLDSRQIICDENKIHKRTIVICKLCKREFYAINSNQVRYSTCSHCYSMYRCKNCGNYFRSNNPNSYCSLRCKALYEKSNNIGMFSKESRNKITKSLKDNGFFDSDKQIVRSKLAQKSLKDNNQGFYNKDFLKVVSDKGRATEKQLGLCFWNLDFQKEMSRRSAILRSTDEYLKAKFRQIAINNLKGYIKESSFKIVDNVVYYNNQKWEDYKSNFQLLNYQEDICSHYKNGYWQLTYRKYDDKSSGQLAMEYELVERNITWFVYIKFYIDDNDNIKPLIVGKSGSKLVNIYGSDISFDLNNSDYKAGRRFVIENNYKLLKSQIYIIPCESQNEAYKLEQDIRFKYNLFES